jgi:hypothetical protein
MNGGGTNYLKTGAFTAFDLTTASEALYLPIQRIGYINASCGVNSDPVAAGRITLRFILEYFYGAILVGGNWTGGSWTPLITGTISSVWDASGTSVVGAGSVFEYDPTFPTRVPIPSMMCMDPTKNIWTTPNTHTATPVVGETDLRCYFQDISASGDDASVDVSINVQMVDQ